MSAWRLLFHVHTRHSIDCDASVEDVVETAVRLGADALVVADHGTVRGSLEARAYAAARHPDLFIPMALEAITAGGDLIGVLLREEPPQGDPVAFCDAVHAQGGLVVLPHPYRAHRLEESWLSRVDLIETFNARTPADANARAVRLAEERSLPILAACDAHRAAEMQLAATEFLGERPDSEEAFRAALVTAERRFDARYGSPWDEWRSQAVKWRRKPNLSLAGQLARGAVTRILRPGKYRPS